VEYASDILLAFRDGDRNENGRIGALFIAETMQHILAWHREWVTVHSKK
jgi:hypothetical protein